MKQNVRASSNTIRSVKQDTQEIRSSIVRIENHMDHYNVGMNNLINHVKVYTIVFWHCGISQNLLFIKDLNLNNIFNPLDEVDQHLQVLPT